MFMEYVVLVINFYIINDICFNAFLPVLMVLPADKHFGIHILQTKAKYNIMFFENLNNIDNPII